MTRRNRGPGPGEAPVPRWGLGGQQLDESTPRHPLRGRRPASTCTFNWERCYTQFLASLTGRIYPLRRLQSSIQPPKPLWSSSLRPSVRGTGSSLRCRRLPATTQPATTQPAAPSPPPTSPPPSPTSPVGDACIQPHTTRGRHGCRDRRDHRDRRCAPCASSWRRARAGLLA